MVPPPPFPLPLPLPFGQILVLILSVEDANEVVAKLRKEEDLEDSCGMENALVMAFLVPKEDEEKGSSQKPLGQEMPYKSLLNALSDLCQTRCGVLKSLKVTVLCCAVPHSCKKARRTAGVEEGTLASLSMVNRK